MTANEKYTVWEFVMKEDIRCVSTTYEERKVFGTVWQYADYEELLKKLLMDNKLIVGGDVLVCDLNGNLASSGNNWYYEGQSGVESNLTAQKYLAGLLDWARREELFITFLVK